MSAMASQTTNLTIVYSKDLFKAQINENNQLRVTGLYAENSPITGEFPAQRASNAKNISIWWRHHEWLADIKHRIIICVSKVLFIFFQNGESNCLANNL